MENRFDWKSKLPKKNQWLILLLAGVLLVVVAIPVKEKEEKITVEPAEPVTEDDYVLRMEKRLEHILEKIDGAGNVEVMITFQSSFEKVIEKDSDTSNQMVEETDKSGGKRVTTDQTNRESTIYQQTSDGVQNPYVSKEILPRAEGILVIAEGGGNPVVAKNITEAVQALFDVDTHKIKVTKGG